jgi:uncharacterized protein
LSEKKRFLFVVTTGMNEPKKAFTPFYYASASAAMGFETTIFLAAEGPSLLKREVAENLRTNEDGEPLQKVIDMAMKNGVKFVCCSTAGKVIWKMKDEDLPPGVEFGGAVTLLEMAADQEASVLYF